MSDNPNFVPLYSTDEVYVGADSTICLTDELMVINDTLDTIPNSSEFASVGHTHNEYALSTDLNALEDVIDTKANATHTHSEYASSSHAHSDYATVIALDTLGVEVDEKADVNHTHTEYASSDHIHTEYSPYIHSHDNYAPTSHSHTEYAEVSHIHDEYSMSTHTHTASEVGAASNIHNHDSDYANINHNHENVYAVAGHDHDEDYAAIDHAHSGYATTTALNEVSSAVSGKANASHTHNDIYYTETEMDTKLASKSDTSHTHTGVYDTSGAASSALASANAYTDSKIDALVGDGASTTLDTIGEISAAIEDNQDTIDLLNAAIANKSNATDLTSHTGNASIHVTSTDKSNWNTAKTHADSSHAPSNAQPNQNAFSNIVIGNTTIAADTTTDTITLVAGTNVTLTPDTTGDSITISSIDTNTTYSAGTGISLSGTTFSNSGVRSVTTGSSNGTISVNTNGITTNVEVKGLGSAAYTASTAYDAFGSANTALVNAKAYTDEVAEGKANASHTHIISNITNLQTTLDGKATSNHTHSVVTTSTAGLMSASDKSKLDGIANGANAYTLPTASSTLGGVKTTSTVTSASGYTACPIINGVPYYKDTNTTYNLGSFGITATSEELNYMDGVTSNVQTQLNTKASSSHTHNYAGSSSVGGAATSANKLNTNAGNANQPVYFANGVPVTCTYTIGKSVPSDAKFTDTTYGTATTSTNGLMSASDKSKLDGMVFATVSEVETYLAI